MALSTDSFNRADSSTTMGSTDGAGSVDPVAWAKPNGGGPFGISSNRAYCPGGNLLTTVECSATDIDITVTVQTVSSGCGIVFRYASFNNYWAWINNTGGVSQLYKVVAGSFTQVGTNQSGAASGDTLRVVCNGNAIEVFRNGTSKITTTDSFVNTGTKHGLYFQGGSDRIDDWSAAAFGSATQNIAPTGITSTLTFGTPSVSGPAEVMPTLTYSLDTPSAATAAGYMVLG